jgi:protein-tyrosine phosphatase
MSVEKLLPERESRMVDLKSIGLTEDFADCPKDWIEKMHGHLEEKYGGVKEYCTKIGFGEEERSKLIGLLKA